MTTGGCRRAGRRSARAWVCAFACAVLAAGCAHAPASRYYTLDMARSGQTDCPRNLVVTTLRAAEPLTRRALLIRKDPTELEYYAGHEWAARVEELVAEKLEAEFGPPRDGRETLEIEGTVTAFEQVDVPGGAEARIRLRLAFRRAGERGDPLLTKTYEAAARAASATPKDVAVGLSRAVEQVAREIAADAAAL